MAPLSPAFHQGMPPAAKTSVAGGKENSESPVENQIFFFFQQSPGNLQQAGRGVCVFHPDLLMSAASNRDSFKAEHLTLGRGLVILTAITQKIAKIAKRNWKAT